MSTEIETTARADVLLVDDNPSNLLALEAILSDLDANLVRAGSGTEALRRLLQQDFAVILLDVQMPEMDGFETATLIRQRERSRAIPIIFLTAFPSNDSQVFQGYAIGAVDFMFKPIVPATLKSKVSVFIELFKKTAEIKRQEALLREVQKREHEQKLVDAKQRWESERLRESNERLKLLAEIANRLLTDVAPERLLGPLAAQIAGHLGLEIFLHYRVDETGKALVLESCSGLPKDEERYQRLPFGQGGSGTAAQQRQRVVFENIPSSSDPRVGLMQELDIGAFVSVPLIAQQHLLGVLSFGTRNRPYLKTEELAVLELVCDQMAMTLERMQLIAELQRRAKDLAEVDRRKDQFLAMLAHELRNPLAPIVNALEVMRLREEQDPVRLHAARIMGRQVQHMVRLVDDLLDVSRISTGKVTLRQEQVLLAEIVQQAVETSRPLITERNHQFDITLPDDPVGLFADRTRLSQVISNLLNNAAKYTDAGGRIELVCERIGNEAVIRVRDTGIGISAELLPRIFDLFVQADRASDRALGGLGIGLTVVQRLVEMHGGSIVARSEGLGRGSEFVVRIPCLVQSAEAPAEAAQAGRPEGSAQPGLHILLVEDHPDIRESMAYLLLAHGHQVDSAGDGVEGIRKAVERQPDVAIIDIGLPKLDGYQVAEHIRTKMAQPPMLIALSGYSQPADRSRASAVGFSAHLVKPVRLEELLRVLGSVRTGK